jgi:hypothetical protein
MWVWLIVAWSTFVLARALVPRPSGWMPALASIAGLAAAGTAGAVAAAAEKPDQHVALYRPISMIDARLNRTIAPNHPVRFDGKLDVATQPVKASVRYDLARRGDRVLSRGASLRNGRWYELDHRPYDTVVTLTDRRRRPNSGASLVIRVGYVEAGTRSSVYVWISRRVSRYAAHAASTVASATSSQR